MCTITGDLPGLLKGFPDNLGQGNLCTQVYWPIERPNESRSHILAISSEEKEMGVMQAGRVKCINNVRSLLINLDLH